MPLVFGAQGVAPTLRGQATDAFVLEPGQTMTVPAGTWLIGKKYARVQYLDQITGVWRNFGDDGPWSYIRSDGANVRLANQTGCAIGAIITGAGSGHSAPPTVTVSAGGSVWQGIIGGAVNTSVTVVTGGTNYQYPPSVQFAAPPSPGIQATGYCTLSGGNVYSITVIDQGAGYTYAPAITIINDPREGLNGTTVGAGASASCSLTGAGTLTGLLCLDHGTTLSAVPTLTFTLPSGGTSAIATVVMDFTLNDYTVTAPGAGLTSAVGAVEVSAVQRAPTATPVYTNPTMQASILRGRKASLYGTTDATGRLTTTHTVQVLDGGHYSYIPGVTEAEVMASGLMSVAPTMTFVAGGQADVVEMFAI